MADPEPKPRNGNSPRLERLEDRLDELDLRLSRLEESGAPANDLPSRSRLLRDTRRLQDYRNALFGSELFGDPAWDILVELYEAELEGKRLIVSKLGRASGVSPTTALRWADRLEAGGWLERVPDPKSQRRIFAVLTAPASSAMQSYMDRLQSLQSRD